MTSGSSGRPEILTPRARALLPVFLVILLFFAVRLLWFTEPDRVVLSGATMGTTWAVTLNAPGSSRDEIDGARAAIEARLEAVNGLMSSWDPASELSRFNRHASLEPFPVSAETLRVLRVAREVSEGTDGAFDVTVGPLVAAWGFGAGARTEDPSPEVLSSLRSRVGYALLDLGEGSVRKRRPDLECDLSAIAKGYGVDEVARVLEARGFRDYFVEIGGEVRVAGQRPGGEAWRVGIEQPDAEGRTVRAVVALEDASMATSGDYRNFYDAGGERRTHIIDPRTGRPVTHDLASVSVIHAEAAVADAWATALTVLGPEEGVQRAEGAGLAAYFIVRVGPGAFLARATTAFPPFLLPAASSPSARDERPPSE